MRFLIVTCQRRSEAAGLRRADIDGADWRLPAERTKTGIGHLVPLSPLALEILADCEPDQHEDGNTNRPAHVFTTDARGDLPASAWSKFKAKLDEKILGVRREDAEAVGADPEKVEPLAHWTLHDL